MMYNGRRPVREPVLGGLLRFAVLGALPVRQQLVVRRGQRALRVRGGLARRALRRALRARLLRRRLQAGLSAAPARYD